MTLSLDRPPHSEQQVRSIPQIYAAIGVPEYWVIDIQGRRVLMFVLEGLRYRQVEASTVMVGLTVGLLEEALGRWEQEEGIEIGNWFMQQISRSGEMQ